ncbi:hypothetical protein J7438_24330 [Thalassotalea sp. G20_0]|uniref:hypothetical protein n=1 Tax=Thalassotalea sp. G20_0 TaxID=2821093 RepID=UPI001ADA5B31|nr:hypothetical protein [Thalassotalea sp. G20_0]MBO9497190.1 hypothetical protein [Thalassotalea sp. G20_0]
MNQIYNLPSFDIAFSGLYSGTSDLINQPCPLDVRKQQQALQGVSGETLDSPFSLDNSQSDIHKDEVGIFKSLHEYDIVSLSDFDPENSKIPKSVLDKYVPWDSDDEISSISDSPFTQQVCLPVSEHDPIPTRHSRPDDHLTHLPAVLFNRPGLPPVTLVNQINLNQKASDKQTTPVEEIADSLLIERQMERRQKPEKRNLKNQRKREQMQDPEKRKLKSQRERERMQDPEKRKLKNQRARERYSEIMQDPEKRNLKNQRKRERMQDPEKRKLNSQRERERMQDPEKRKLKNQRARERYSEIMQDPEKRKLRNQRDKERMQDPEKRKLRNQRMQDPEKRKLKNQHARERYSEIMRDPEKRKLKNQRERERRQDPEKRKLRNQRERERRQDPEKRKLRNQRERERRKDPEKRKLRNQRERERRQDPEKRKLRNQHHQASPVISSSEGISLFFDIIEPMFNLNKPG